MGPWVIHQAFMKCSTSRGEDSIEEARKFKKKKENRPARAGK
jgi:hypothetical protein